MLLRCTLKTSFFFPSKNKVEVGLRSELLLFYRPTTREMERKFPRYQARNKSLLTQYSEHGQMRYTEITHRSHPHPLVLESALEPYRCDGCKELGFGPSYKCEGCNFNLHEECAMPEPSASHPFLPGCDFRFHEKAPGFGGRYCDACGKDITGFVYQCLHKRATDLHPCCMKLQRTLTGTLAGDKMTLHLSKNVSTDCLRCGRREIFKRFRGWSYESTCGQYCYHVACVKDLILENWRRGYFNGQNDVDTSNTALQIVVSNQDIVPQRGGSSIRNTASRYWRMAKFALKLIISAIFGDPTAIVATLIESLIAS